MIPDVAVSRPRPGAAVVELRGEHALETQDALDDLLSSLVETNELIVVDVSGARFIDSSVLRNLARANTLAAQRGSLVRLQVDTDSIVHTTLEISGLLGVLPYASDRAQALAPDEPEQSA